MVSQFWGSPVASQKSERNELGSYRGKSMGVAAITNRSGPFEILSSNCGGLVVFMKPGFASVGSMFCV